MSRARDIADFNPSLFATDEISGDKVSGGTIGAGTFDGTIGASAVGDGIITCAESLTLNATTAEFNTSTITLSGFTKRTDYGNVASITESSGNFTTSSTGIFFISLRFNITCANTDPDYIEIDAKQVVDGTETLISRGVTSVRGSSSQVWKTVSMQFLYDWQNTSHTLIFKAQAESNTRIMGDTNGVQSIINFLRIGNT
tara:strand:- start:366 stop:962 length:597 start_codon:yes stop_codon:yes gene_type:complete